MCILMVSVVCFTFASAMTTVFTFANCHENSLMTGGKSEAKHQYVVG